MGERKGVAVGLRCVAKPHFCVLPVMCCAHVCEHLLTSNGQGRSSTEYSGVLTNESGGSIWGKGERGAQTGVVALHGCVLEDGSLEGLNLVLHGLVGRVGRFVGAEQLGELFELGVELVSVLAHHLIVALTRVGGLLTTGLGKRLVGGREGGGATGKTLR